MQKIIYVFLSTLISIVSTANAFDVLCLARIGADNASFVTPMYNDVLSGQPPIQENIDANNTKMFNLVAKNVRSKCIDNASNKNDILAITDSTDFIIPFVYKDNKKYKMQVDTKKLFEFMKLPTAFLIINNRTLVPGDIIKKSDITPDKYFFSDTCSDHTVRVNLSNTAAVNVAGRKAFGEYNDEKNSEYFLDMPVGKTCRVFPGLVLGDFGGLGAPEGIITYTNFLDAKRALQTFHDALNNSTCSNQNLAIYLVSFNNINSQIGSHWGEWASAIAGPAGFGIYLLFAKKLPSIDELQILDGPYNIQ